jgi:STAS-like domain of unknown function (DUF4325)
MVRICVVDLVGPVCVDPEDGAVLCRHALAAMASGLSVTLDFGGVRALTSSFLNSAVGCLLASFPRETIKEKLSWSGLDAADDELVDLVLKNANRYYSATPEARAALASAANRIVED